jgi:GDPmannose 4,6-dehydratase
MKPRILIFGAGGQLGRFLALAGEARGCEVIASRHDVCDARYVAQIIGDSGPAMICNLAATSATEHATAAAHHATIGGGTLNILEAVAALSPKTRVFLAGSVLQLRNRGLPIGEDDPPSCESAYAVARNYSLSMASYYRDRMGVNVKFGIMFHHESPLRKPHFVSRMVADAARRMRDGGSVKLPLRDASVVKEWTWAGDTAEAVFTFMEQDEFQVANIGSGIGHSIEEWACRCFALVGRHWSDGLTVEEPASNASTVANPARLLAMGWRPKVDLAALAEIMVNGGQ